MKLHSYLIREFRMHSSMMLQGKQIDFSYPGESIFKGLNFTLNRGERVVLKGESGSGKSTFFRLILGFEYPTSGEILFDQKPLKGKHLQNFRTHSAWLPQDLNFGEGNVSDVIRFPFSFKNNESTKPDEQKIIDIFKDLGLEEDTLKKPFQDLSTGQRQRVGIALCILLNKPVMLLDEPTSALDENSKEKAIQHLFSDKNRTILSTSHDPFWIDRCDRIIHLDQ